MQIRPCTSAAVLRHPAAPLPPLPAPPGLSRRTCPLVRLSTKGSSERCRPSSASSPASASRPTRLLLLPARASCKRGWMRGRGWRYGWRLERGRWVIPKVTTHSAAALPHVQGTQQRLHKPEKSQEPPPRPAPPHLQPAPKLLPSPSPPPPPPAPPSPHTPPPPPPRRPLPPPTGKSCSHSHPQTTATPTPITVQHPPPRGPPAAPCPKTKASANMNTHKRWAPPAPSHLQPFSPPHSPPHTHTHTCKALPKRALKSLSGPRKPGMRKSKRDHSSSTSFWMGVPLSSSLPDQNKGGSG